MNKIWQIQPSMFQDDMISILGVCDRPEGLELTLLKEAPDGSIENPKWFKMCETVVNEKHTHIFMSSSEQCGTALPSDLRLMYTIIKSNDGIRTLYYGPSISHYRKEETTPLKLIVLNQLRYDLQDSFNEIWNQLSAWVESFIKKNQYWLTLLAPSSMEEVYRLLRMRDSLYQQARAIGNEVSMHEWLSDIFLEDPLRYSTGLAYHTLKGSKSFGDPTQYLNDNDYKCVGSPGRVLGVPGAQPNNAFNPHLHTLDNPKGFQFLRTCYELLDELLNCPFAEFSISYEGMNIRINFVSNLPGDGTDLNCTYTENDKELRMFGIDQPTVRKLLQMLHAIDSGNVNMYNTRCTVCKTFNESVAIVLEPIHPPHPDHDYPDGAYRRAFYFDLPLTMMYLPGMVSQIPFSLQLLQD